ncbi:MAG: histidine--tRNA ligase [Planctomycetota bacterium]
MADPQRPRPRKPKGFRDAFAQDCRQRQNMIDTICSVYRKYGFEQLETPCIEYVDALGKFLPEQDQPDAGVFAMKDDQDDKWLALRYDLTAPLARTIAEYGDNLPTPFRRYQYGPVWRRERKPGKDRFREFFQCDFDTVGCDSMAADAEVCLVLSEAMQALGIDQFVIRVNNRKVLNGLLGSLAIDDPKVRLDILRTLDKLDDIGVRGVREQLGPGRQDKSGSFNDGLNLPESAIESVVGFLECRRDTRSETCDAFAELVQEGGAEGVEELRRMETFLATSNISEDQIRFDPSLVRGLEYYTGPVFEIELPFEIKVKGKTKKFGSVAGGGRYDYLVERFTGRTVPATGASIGVDRLLAALNLMNAEAVTEIEPGPVVVTVMDQDRELEYQKIVNELRSAGIRSELYLGGRKFKAQMKYADKRNAPAVVIAGSDEFEAGTLTIKNMFLGSKLAAEVKDNEAWRKGQPAQSTIARDQLVTTIQAILSDER